VNGFGRGRAVLLNFSMWSYPNVWSPKAPRGAAELLENTFAAAGVEWPLRLLHSDGKPYRQVEAVRWKTGEQTEVVIIRGPLEERHAHPTPGVVPVLDESDTPLPMVDKSPPVHIRLPEPRYIGEIGTGRLKGPTTHLTTDKGLWWPALVVLSDRPLEAPILKAAQDRVERGGMMPLQIEIPGASDMHAIKLRAKGPGGNEAPWFNRSVIVKGGSAEIDLPIAHNEVRGNWSVTATDLYTGETGAACFVVD
jgi:hypothetical protein